MGRSSTLKGWMITGGPPVLGWMVRSSSGISSSPMRASSTRSSGPSPQASSFIQSSPEDSSSCSSGQMKPSSSPSTGGGLALTDERRARRFFLICILSEPGKGCITHAGRAATERACCWTKVGKKQVAISTRAKSAAVRSAQPKAHMLVVPPAEDCSRIPAARRTPRVLL